MAQNQLAVYNIAMRALGERSIGSLTEETEARRVMDEIWNSGDGAVKYLLEQGHWDFGTRAVLIDSDADITPSFGYSYAFTRPTDFVYLNALSADEYFSVPLTDYEPEGAYFYADVDPLYMSYVSDDASYGSDMTKWPESFMLWSGHWMAVQAAPRLKNDLDMERLEKRTARLLSDARSKDANSAPARFPPMGGWASARLGGRVRRDRGSRSRLIG